MHKYNTVESAQQGGAIIVEELDTDWNGSACKKNR